MCWEVWKCRNHKLFEGEFNRPWVGAIKAINYFKELYKERAQKRKRFTKAPFFSSNFPICLFDGASQDHGEKCGVGVVLKL